MKHRIAAMLLALTIAWAGISSVAANGHPDLTYEELVEWYADWTRADIEELGWEVEEFCVDAASAGRPAELGGIGFHAVHPVYLRVPGIDPDKPEAFLLDGDGNVIGVEYRLLKVMDEPVTIGRLEQPLRMTSPLPGVEQEHMALHVYFVGDEEHRFSTWNPAVTCPEDSTPPAPKMLPKTGAPKFSNNVLALLLSGLGGVLLVGGGWYLRRRSDAINT